MCGICGIFGKEDKQLVKRMSQVLQHRGPDQSGVFTDKNVSLGHQRLSIVDLSKKGMQPMSNEEGDVWITYNGEIYNFREIREDLERKGYKFKSETDTEVIVHAYEEYGTNCLQLFNGCFAFAIYDSNKNQIFLARDRLGIKPLYYTFNKGVLFFASEIKSILTNEEIRREVNKDALNTYLTFRANTDKETFFKGVFKLMPAHYLVFDGKNFIEQKYWSLNIKIKNKSLSYYEKLIKNELTKSIKRRLMGEVPLGVYLSGGIDSASIVGLLHSFAENRIKTFSVGFGYEEQNTDMNSANLIADHFGTDHHILTVEPDTMDLLPKIIYHSDEPMADPTSIPTFILSEFTKNKGVTIVLTGEGSDEIFCGYEQYKFCKLYQNFLRYFPYPIKSFFPFLVNKSPNRLLDFFFPYASNLGKKGIERFSNYLKTKKVVDAYLELISIFNEKEKKSLLNNYNFSYNLPKKLNNNFFLNNNHYLYNLMKLELDSEMVDDLLMKVDKNTMAFSVEARVPFLDHMFLEKTYQIPISYKMRGFTEKYVLRKAMRNILPKQSTWTKKKRFFVPINYWFEGELMETAKQLLDSNIIKKQNIFSHQYIEKLFKKFKSSNLFYSRQLWNLLTFQIWHNLYIENNGIIQIKELKYL